MPRPLLRTFSPLFMLASLLLVGCDDDDKAADETTKSADSKDAKSTTRAAAAPKKAPGPPLKGGTKMIRKIREDFEASHSAAKAKYAGRQAQLAGRVSMTISDSFRFSDTGIAKRGTADILCRAKDAKVVGGLKKGNIVVVTGTIVGTVGNIRGGNIEMSPCQVKEKK